MLSPMATAEWGIHELEKATGVPMRTLRHWVKKGLLPRPRGRGRVAKYTSTHVLRAQLVRHLRAKKLSLRQIQNRIGGLSDEELKALLPPPPRPASEPGMPAPLPPTSYPSSQWELVILADGLILLVNPKKGPGLQRIADEIYKHYSVSASAPG